tara:strand:- start:2409 stop:3485 length:1077 start_codon:yes stop_codon:yes gene_type:complete
MPKLLSPLLLFLVSISVEIISLILLRLIGIDWDYHIDAVTYVEKSQSVASAIFNNGKIFGALNNGYYLLVDLLGSNPGNIITLNIILFGLTNILITKLMRPFRHENHAYFEYLVLFNPYRVYLATTLLKDTLLCFLLVTAYYFYHFKKNREFNKVLSIKDRNLELIIRKFFIDKIIFISCSITLIFFAVRSIFYLTLFPNFLSKVNNLRSFFYFIVFILGINFLISNITGGNIINNFESASNVNMDFRSYGAIPNFSSFGNLGILLKIVFWPLFYISGIFIFFSPSIELFFISIGISLVFLLQIREKITIPIGTVIGFVFFAGITNGFLSFARYSLPIWLISVIIIYRRNKNFIDEQY